jgi:hypothetical protein
MNLPLLYDGLPKSPPDIGFNPAEYHITTNVKFKTGTLINTG